MTLAKRPLWPPHRLQLDPFIVLDHASLYAAMWGGFGQIDDHQHEEEKTPRKR